LPPVYSTADINIPVAPQLPTIGNIGGAAPVSTGASGVVAGNTVVTPNGNYLVLNVYKGQVYLVPEGTIGGGGAGGPVYSMSLESVSPTAQTGAPNVFNAPVNPAQTTAPSLEVIGGTGAPPGAEGIPSPTTMPEGGAAPAGGTPPATTQPSATTQPPPVQPGFGAYVAGFGAAIGGIGTDRYQIEEVAIRHKIPIYAIVIKQSIKEAIALMKKEIADSAEKVSAQVQEMIRENTKIGQSVLIIGVGNTLGVSQ